MIEIEKIKAIIEHLEDNKVVVHSYDTDENIMTTGGFAVLSKEDAKEEYDIIGELINGELQLYEESEVEENYPEMEIDEDD